MSDLDEPILAPTTDRFLLTPSKEHSDLWKLYKNSMASFWSLEEIDISSDFGHYNSLTKDEKHFINMVLAFFAASDGIVNENLASRFFTEVQLPEARAFYGFQIAMENVHAETYAVYRG